MTKKIKSVVYGVGGFDDTKPDNNIIGKEYYSDDQLAELAEAEAKETAKTELLAKLGITAEEAALLLS
jgi:hypothetical protein